VPNGFYNVKLVGWDEGGNQGVAPISTVEVAAPSTIGVQETARGLAVSLSSNVLYGSGRATLKTESQSSLDQVISLLKAYPTNSVLIEGHTDGVGSADSNKTLGSKRAWAVYSYLVKHGVDPQRLTVKGVGEAQPIASNKTAAGREKNRRVEVIILKDAAESVPVGE